MTLRELAEIWQRAAINHAFRTSATWPVSDQMPVSEMFKIAAAIRARAARAQTASTSHGGEG